MLRNIAPPLFSRISTIRILFFLLLLNACIDPTTPEYEFIDGQILIEGFAATTEGASFVTIKRTSNEFGLFRNIFEEGAKVSFRNTVTNEIVVLEEQVEVYVPPLDFVCLVGESWELEITLADGSQYLSKSETVIEPVQISSFNVDFDPQLRFIEGQGTYVPGHAISVTFDDPANRDDYYYWRFRSFESLPICQYCPFGTYRNEVCGTSDFGYTYACETSCWRIRYNQEINIFADKLTNGTTITELPVANVLLYTNQNILVNLDQFSLSPKAYEYYKTLSDLVDNSGNFNAPPPSALVGNLFNPNNDGEYVLGRFTAAAVSSVSVFIDRRNITQKPLDDQPPLRFESGFGAITTAPCYEGLYRTGMRPDGWVD